MTLDPNTGPPETTMSLEDQIAMGEFLQSENRRLGRPDDPDIARQIEAARALLASE